MPSPSHAAAALLRSLRPLHWTKNLLVFAPVVLAHRVGDRSSVAGAVAAFAAFSIAASGTYLINDVRDAEQDRAHPTKRRRMIAAGALAAAPALVAGVILLLAGLTMAWLTEPQLAAFLLGYGVLSLFYSVDLKRRVFIDVLALSALYTIRVLAGGAASGVEVSDWLLALSVFLFVSLALLKRYADLRMLAERGHELSPGRGYRTADIDLLRSMGVASGYLAVLVLALYVSNPQVTQLYRAPRLLWLICPLLLYWVAHMWFLAHRGAIEDDPIVVAVRDPASYVVGALIIAVAAAAT